MNVKTIERMIAECSAQLSSIGVTHGKITKVVINDRAKSMFGRCAFDRKTNTYTIEMMSFLNSFRTEQEIKNTVMHEILHTVSGCVGHQATWQNLAKRVNRSFGYSITTTSKSPPEARQAKVESAKWTLSCDCCEKVMGHYQRRPKVTATSYHVQCGLKSKGKLKLIQNR